MAEPAPDDLIDFSIPDFTEPLSAINRRSPPKKSPYLTINSFRKTLSTFLEKANENTVFAGKAIDEQTRHLNDHLDMIEGLKAKVSELEEKLNESDATVSSLLGRINSTDETILEMIDNTKGAA